MKKKSQIEPVLSETEWPTALDFNLLDSAHALCS